MALIHSGYAKGTLAVARPQTAHATHSQLFIVDVPATGFAGGDILELGVLPPYSHIVDAAVVGISIADAATVDVGIMSGEVGEALNPDGTARTNDTTLFNDAALTGIVRLSQTNPLVLAQADKPRSIGVTFGAAVAAGAGKKIGLLVHFVQ